MSIKDTFSQVEIGGMELPFDSDSKTKVTTDLDFNADGKQLTTLKIPHSTNTSAWGRVLIPIAQFKNGDGPTIFLSGGIHGDEFEGTVALTKIIQRLKVENVKGRIIIMPSVNFPAHLNSSRISPIDNLDLNRIFPGNRNGTLTQVLAHYIDTIIIPKSDVVIDMHSGGASLDFAPCVVIHELEDKELQQKTMDAAKKHGAPFALFLKEGDPEGLLDTAVEKRGKIFISTEFRGGATVNKGAVDIADNGICNLLKHFGTAKLNRSKYTNYKSCETAKILHTSDESCFIGSPEEGLYEPLVELGEKVSKGQPIAQLHCLTTLNRRPKILKSAHDGYLICKRVQGRTNSGDCLAVVGIEMDWEKKNV